MEPESRCVYRFVRFPDGSTGAGTRTHRDLDALAVGTEAGLTINEASEGMAAVQNGDQFHGVEGSFSERLL